MSQYPSTIAAITDPQASDRLNSPSHSALHQTENDEIEQTQRFVGTTSSAIGTLVYDIRAAASDGGGHVQSAAKGGTGQTIYTKGDLLVGLNSSTLSKLAVGIEGQVLAVASVAATGVQWTNSERNKIKTSGSVITVIAGAGEASLLTASIPGSTLGTSNAIRSKLYVSFLGTDTNGTSTLKVLYGTSSIVSINITGGGVAASSLQGTIETILISQGSQTSQLGTVNINLSQGNLGLHSTSVQGLVISNTTRPIYQDSGAIKTFGITYIIDGAAGNRVDTGGYTVEKIS